MSKEWLEDWLKDKKEQLKRATVFINENGNEAVEVSLSVLNKLFEQAERVQELEEQNKRYLELLNKVAYEDIDFKQTVNIVREYLG